ncbi:MAG: hypothetical protein P8O96_03625 [Flavobacteriaceae bacterium]|nr:hypothetical protein [Flavobacteriaceae bacterium]
MINILKKRIEEKIGRPVATRGDCELVSNAITENLDIDISCSTIRRLYGLAPYTKPNNKTTNTLAQFIGYKNYIHFTQTHLYKEKIDLSQIIYKVVYDGDEAVIIALVKSTKKSIENFTGFIVLLIRELLHMRSYRLIDELFRLKELAFENFTYSEVLYLGNSLGLLVRKQPELDTVLLRNTNFLQCVYLTFVDYSNLNGYYGSWTETIARNPPTKEITVFTSAIVAFKNFLNHKKMLNRHKDLIFSTDLNPILCSRLLALKLLANEPQNSLEILNAYNKIHLVKSNKIDYYYELYTTAILTKNQQLMKFLIDKITFDQKPDFYYQKNHMNSFYLMCAFYYKIQKDTLNEKKNIRLFRLENCPYSYQDFITIIYQIYEFGNTKTTSKKKLIKKTYTDLGTQLNYSYFSEDFLLNYFN